MTTQKGFAHAFLIIGLVVALIGALGFVFWQNFIYKEPVVTKTEIVKTNSDSVGDNTKPQTNLVEVTKTEISKWIQDNSEVDIERHMASTVNYAIAQSDGILKDAPKSKVKANMSSYLAGHVNEWVSQDFEKISGHDKFITQAESDQYFDFSGSYVSLNTGTDYEDFAAFKINKQGLITDVYVGSVFGY